VLISKFHVARRVVHPLMYYEISRAGLRLLPMFFIPRRGAGISGHRTKRFGLCRAWVPSVYFGKIMVFVVVRELGPLIAALLVLARVGTANVVELGTARAMGEVEGVGGAGD